MKVAVIFVALLFTTCFLSSVDSWRRRRRRRCKRDCTLDHWSSWSTCTKRCGSGTRSRSRGISVPALCGGTCNHAFKETQNCNTQCCGPVNCVWSWNAWGPCSGCGISSKTRTIKTSRNPSCGGTACPSQTNESISCDTGVWVKCHVNIDIFANFDAGYGSLAFNQAYSPIIVTTTFPCYVIKMLNVYHNYCNSLSSNLFWTTTLSLNHNCLEFRRFFYDKIMFSLKRLFVRSIFLLLCL